jgi:hypothetical protein
VFWKGSVGKLHWARHAWSSLDRMEFSRAPSCFYLTVWFERERCEAMLIITIIWHVFLSMVKSVSGECHGGRDLWTHNGGSSLCGEVELAW